MSRFDYADPGTDPAYCDPLQADEPQDGDDNTVIDDVVLDLRTEVHAVRRQLAETQARLTRIVDALIAFSDAPISISTLQPILDLAAEAKAQR